MESAFKAWVGQPVVLQVALGDIKVPLRGKLLKDGSDTVRMRIGEGWDVDIYKTMIVAVEEDGKVLFASSGGPARKNKNSRTRTRGPQRCFWGSLHTGSISSLGH